MEITHTHQSAQGIAFDAKADQRLGLELFPVNIGPRQAFYGATVVVKIGVDQLVLQAEAFRGFPGQIPDTAGRGGLKHRTPWVETSADMIFRTQRLILRRPTVKVVNGQFSGEFAKPGRVE